MKFLSAAEAHGGTIYVSFEAMSTTGKKFSFDSKRVEFDDSTDERIVVATEKRFLAKDKKVFAKRYKNPSSDWAYIKLGNRKGKTIMNADLSSTLKAGTKLYALGYSYGLGLQSGGTYREAGLIKYEDIEPQFSEVTVAKNGLTNGVIQVSNHGYGPGSSGGPVYLKNDGSFEVVGIVAYSIGSNLGLIVPVSNLR